MNRYINEPYRIFFLVGFLFFLCGIFLWVPQIWNPGEYPVETHRRLMLSGFLGCFIGGFLMTAVPKFSETWPAHMVEVALYAVATFAAIFSDSRLVILQPVLLLVFLVRRISARKQNPPYSFAFIFIGLLFWILGGFNEDLRRLHHEGALACIILGVGSRLIPGILGHIEIVAQQRSSYENRLPLYKTMPLSFLFVMISFAGSYFFEGSVAAWIRACVVGYIALRYWRLYELPKKRSALTFCIWTSAWLMLMSFVLIASIDPDDIHNAHAVFINVYVLLTFLIATRVLQSHGPKIESLENSKVLYVLTGLVFIASATRVCSPLMPETYLRHLGYSGLLLALGGLFWAWKFLRFVRA
jgi:uncharacterized protein involved in response to NO